MGISMMLNCGCGLVSLLGLGTLLLDTSRLAALLILIYLTRELWICGNYMWRFVDCRVVGMLSALGLRLHGVQ